MRTLQYAAAVVLLALLAVIAYDLHRVAGYLNPSKPLTASEANYLGVGAETRAQRIERKARETADDSDELIATISRAGEISRERKKAKSTSSR